MTKRGKCAHASKRKKIRRSGLKKLTCHLIVNALIRSDCGTATLRILTFMEDKSKRQLRQSRSVIGWNMSIT